MHAPSTGQRADTAEILRFADFLEPPAREGLGAAPAPALGDAEADTEAFDAPDLWFVEAAERDEEEAATVLVPDDVLRHVQELRETRHAPTGPPSVLVDRAALEGPSNDVHPDSDLASEDEDLDIVRPLGTRLAARLPHIALAASVIASVLSVVALLARTPAAEVAVAGTGAAAAPAPARDTVIPAPPLSAAASTAAPGPTDEAFESTPDEVNGPTPVPAAPRHAASPTPRTGRTLIAPGAGNDGGPAARFMRNGRAAYDRGAHAAALTWYRRAAEAAPANAEAQFGVALSAFELRRDAMARRSLEDLLAREPDHARGHLLMAMAAQAAGDTGRAAAHYDRYVTLEPDGTFAAEVREIRRRLGR